MYLIVEGNSGGCDRSPRRARSPARHNGCSRAAK